VVAPVYHGLAFDPFGRQVDAAWIWHEEIELDRRVLPKPGRRLFRKRFSLQEGPALKKVEVLITADNTFSFYLNGREIDEAKDWRQVRHLEIPVDLLQKENLIAIAGANEGVIPNPAGLLFSMRLGYADSTFQYIHSDRSWKSSPDTLAQDWKTAVYDDSTWRQAWQAGAGTSSYWGALLDFTFDPDSVELSMARASLVRQDDFMKTLGRPVRENVVTQRSGEATLLQSLLLTNSEFFHENISRGADSWLENTGDDPGQLLDQLYLKALGRTPGRKEKKVLLKKLESGTKAEALEDIIWAIVLLPEFQLI